MRGGVAVINGQECLLDCPRWAFCATPSYTGRCSKICFDLRDKYEKACKTSSAKWKNRAEYNDFIWAECSNCGFRVENYKAVKMTKSDREYDEVIYKFCPMCGKPMEV